MLRKINSEHSLGIIVSIVFFVCIILFTSKGVSAMGLEQKEVDYVLIGASIGNGWKFSELPKRTGIENKVLEFIGVFDSFDKGQALKMLFLRDKKPRAVIIKECSVYFPGDTKRYKSLIKKWVAELQENNIEPVLATTVPSGKPESLTYKLKSTLKKILGKKNKFDEISKYNDWLRVYAEEKNIQLLDLETALRVSEKNRVLKPEYDRGDYTHLNKEAYKTLDNLFKNFLKQGN